MLDLQQEPGPSSIKRVYLLDQEQVDFYWGDIAVGLKDCPGYYDFYTPEWTYQQIRTGAMSVWALSDGAIRGIVLTRILIYPRKKIFDILAIYGLEMLAFFEEMEDVFMRIAKMSGCEEFSTTVRPGVAKFLQKRGYAPRQIGIVLRREISVTGDQ